jgi:hypothetical protein
MAETCARCKTRPAVTIDEQLGPVRGRCWTEASSAEPERAMPGPDDALLPGPRLLGDPDPWDDDLHDALAAVEAVRSDRLEDAAFMVAHAGNIYAYAVTVTKLLAQALEESGTDPELFRRWAPAALSRS